MLDVLIAGAGPAGAIAARHLARAGARVLLVDRDQFPRDKLCGDTLNPGAIRLLESHGLTGGALDTALPLAGMRVTGPGASVEARYAAGYVGASLTRRALDAWLLDEAIAAGARFEPGLTVESALTDEEAGETSVRGLVLRSATGTVTRMPAVVTIGADGRRSAVARSVHLAHHPAKPRRWAYGTYFVLKGADGSRGSCGSVAWGSLGSAELANRSSERSERSAKVGSLGSFGEMHVRPGWYCGVAPLPDGRVNVCVVTDRRDGAGDPLGLIWHYLNSDRELRDRFAGAECVAPVSVLGPLAVDVRSAGLPGLLLAGDAAGFVDPMTGDGLNLAMQGAVMAADEALRVLESGDWNGAVERLNEKRSDVLGRKLKFNRTLRALTSSSPAVRLAGVAALAAPSVIRGMIVRAGDAA